MPGWLLGLGILVVLLGSGLYLMWLPPRRHVDSGSSPGVDSIGGSDSSGHGGTGGSH